jgi:hypothetical protein
MSQAANFRKMFLQAAAAALTSDESKSTILQRLIQAQDRSGVYKRLHHVFKPTNPEAIFHLETSAAEDWQWPYDPKQITEWKREYGTQRVEDRLFEWNILHFAQSK